ncbi:Pr6Pr family membrane protein [Mucilaginibacter pedocola]|uniref:F420-dependent oxidoreductase n=1 Tax=Mucilaginibacter pedocola TaxID=1792845 RepID=A0A1S9PE78_9SPHI|nr:Pr6Pr family membrane protein [Mucilaginibacter pedocola]OOQ59237.1 hypothetical protein BC343_28360 [Mucilaginibacter pedocola]
MALSKTQKTLAAFFAVVAWLGLITQFYVSMPAYLAKGRTIEGAIIELLSFFTIQSNILVAVCLSIIAGSTSDIGFFKRPRVLTAVAVYISIVALVYNLVLRKTFHPVGLARVSDEILHVATPALFLIFWVLIIIKAKFKFKFQDGLAWLWYPLFYLGYILLRGHFTGLYPYFFLDVPKFGYPQVLINIGALVLVFLIMDMLFIWIAKGLSK